LVPNICFTVVIICFDLFSHKDTIISKFFKEFHLKNGVRATLLLLGNL